MDIEKHWASDSINAVTQAGLMNGYGNGLFMPDKPITREEVAKVLYFLVGDEEGIRSVYFTDVHLDRWSYEYITKLASVGVVNGYENEEFRPSNYVSRAEIVTMLKRIFD